jgi:hypothetical protein
VFVWIVQSRGGHETVPRGALGTRQLNGARRLGQPRSGSPFGRAPPAADAALGYALPRSALPLAALPPCVQTVIMGLIIGSLFATIDPTVADGRNAIAVLVLSTIFLSMMSSPQIAFVFMTKRQGRSTSHRGTAQRNTVQHSIGPYHLLSVAGPARSSPPVAAASRCRGCSAVPPITNPSPPPPSSPPGASTSSATTRCSPALPTSWRS